MQKPLKDRFKASFIHMMLSLAVFSVFLYFVFWWWYPAPFFESNGGWSVMAIVMFVDLGIGPLCTFIVYKVGKPGLKFDIIIISAVQIVALLYGANVLYTEKPYVMVHVVDRFVVLAKFDLDSTKLTNPNLIRSPGSGFSTVVAKMPLDLIEQKKLGEQIIFGAPDMEYRPELYLDYKFNLPYVIRQAKDSSIYLNRSNRYHEKINALLEKNDLNIEAVFLYPLVGKKKDLLLMLRREDGSIVGGLNLKPW